MKRILGLVLAGSLGVALAWAQAAYGGVKSGGEVSRLGDNTANLVSGIVGPVLLVAIGAIAFIAMVRREAGLAIAAIGVGLLAGLFIYAPDTAQQTFQGIYQALL